MNELTKRQIKAAQLEAAGYKATEIAKECKITPQTISSYRQVDEYKVLVSKIARATFRASQMRLVEGTHKAVETIIAAMDSDKENIRLRAAESLLKMAGMTEVEDEIGASTIAEHKFKNMYVSTDLGLMENIHSDVDEYLDQLGPS